MVSVAQLVESRIVIPVVAGSSPVVHPIKSSSYQLLMHHLLHYLRKSFYVSFKLSPCETQISIVS